MHIIQFNDTQTFHHITLDISSSASITEANASLTSPCVWIVNQASLAVLRQYSDAIDDKGAKHPAIELSRTMLKGDKIPLIDGQYSSAGKLRNGLERLLQKATGAFHRLMIIGATDEVFDELLRLAEAEPAAYTTRFPLNVKDGHILTLLPDVPEPAELRNAYLGDSVESLTVRRLIMRAALVDDTVLIVGDTGTGKEIVANQIHRNSRRNRKDFVPLNCAAIPSELLESLLFGHVRGAFTGATEDRDGLWQTADGGTLFLDEIGELTPDHQAKLLRVLADNRVRKVGGRQLLNVDARVICATNRDLFGLVQKGRFREDLYYRLRGFLINTPALREHPSDIPILAQSLWKKATKDPDATLPADIVRRLCEYRWPGNVRELEMALIHLYGLFSSTFPLEERHLLAVFDMQGQNIQSKPHNTVASDRFVPFRHLRRVYELIRAIEHALTSFLVETQTDNSIVAIISTTLQAHLNDLEQLVTLPQRFAPHTFDSISLLRSRLIYLLSQSPQSPESAREFIESQIRQAVNDTMVALLAEMDGALALI